MAKVYYTALCDRISGRLGDVVHSIIRGIRYVKVHNPNPNNPNTARQQKVRGHFGDLSEYWYDLPAKARGLWNSYATMAGAAATGRNSFIGQNTRLLAADHPALGCVFYPPPTPSSPSHLTGFSVCPVSPTSNCITWQFPSNVSDYVQCSFRLHSSFCLANPCYGDCNTVGYRPTPRFIETVLSNVGEIVQTHDWPGGARLYFKVRTLDSHGRVSPYSHEIITRVPDE